MRGEKEKENARKRQKRGRKKEMRDLWIERKERLRDSRMNEKV
jgi:hypothetical protein